MPRKIWLMDGWQDVEKDGTANIPKDHITKLAGEKINLLEKAIPEEKTTTKEYEKLGYHKQARQEIEHSKFFKKKLKKEKQKNIGRIKMTIKKAYNSNRWIVHEHDIITEDNGSTFDSLERAKKYAEHKEEITGKTFYISQTKFYAKKQEKSKTLKSKKYWK